MSEIVIEWDRDRVVVASGRREGGSVAIERAAVMARSADAQDTLDVVDRLKSMFGSASAKTRPQVTVVFPRQLVTIHRIQIPQVPDSEIPDIVRLQASMRLTVPVESVCLDFTPLPAAAGSATRDVLLVTVPQEQVALARRTVNDAGFQLAEVRVSAFCMAQAVANAGLLSAQSDGDRVDIIALMRQDFIELTFVRGLAVVFSHSGSSWTSADGVERAIRSELNRARMSAAENLGDHTIGRLILLGAPEVTGAVTDQLASRLDGATIQRIEPGAVLIGGGLPDDIAAIDLVNIAGAISGREQSAVQTVDLINPRRPPEKRDLRRVKILAGLLAAVLLFGAGSMWRQSRLSSLKAAYDLQTATNTEIREELKKAEPELAQAATVSAWVERDLNWLDEMVRLKALLPSTERMFVDKFSFNVLSRNAICSINVEAFARSESDINNLARRLRDAGYAVNAAEPKQRSSAVSDYSWFVQLEVTPPVPGDAPATETDGG